MLSTVLSALYPREEIMRSIGRSTRAAAILATLASIAYVTQPNSAMAGEGGGAECAGETEVICKSPSTICESQSQQNHACTTACGPTWHADDCDAGGEPCLPGDGRIICHKAGN